MVHLIHPAVVHFTLAFLVAGCACEAFGIFSGRERIERFGGVLVVAGTLSLLPTVVTGFLAKNSIDPAPSALDALDDHQSVGLILLGVFVVALLWKGWDGGRVRESARPMYAVLLLVGLGVLTLVAFLGGELVYGHGVGVRCRGG